MTSISTDPGISKDLRFIPLSYNNADSQTSALRLILTLFPNWEHGEGKIEFIRFTDGITNTLLKAVKRRPGYTEEQIDNEAVLLRAYGKGTEVLIDRKKEAVSHSLLSQHKLAPALLARFQNGLIYKFIRGRVCSPEDLTREPVWRGVARKLGEWHATLPIISAERTASIENAKHDVPLTLDVPKSSPSLDQINAITPGKPTPNVWTIMQKWVFALPTTNEAEIRRKKVLQEELERTVSELGDTPGLGEDGLVFGHTDLLSGNVILLPYNTDKTQSQPPSIESVAFIDYEYAVPSPAAFDISNHFAEWGGFSCDFSVLPTRSVRRAFLSEYISSYTSFSPTPLSSSEQDRLATRLFDEVDRFRGVPGLYWGIWALIQATISQIDFDYASYAEVRLGEYWAWRAEVDGSRERKGEEKPLRERRWAEED
ncbi:hypothetical protein JMJ35_008117 [Cladonia borealis]|uniref:ethanolamine kinase n=1 Tax=Cladonia borealis TaxID=184061 RepID=A0AA39QXV3_9LECA|nr:hypothetical protein JMJ35_008117 [Cladonia borealis]